MKAEHTLDIFNLAHFVFLKKKKKSLEWLKKTKQYNPLYSTVYIIAYGAKTIRNHETILVCNKLLLLFHAKPKMGYL